LHGTRRSHELSVNSSEGSELAAGTEGRIPSHAAHVLAEGEGSFHPGRNLEAAGGAEGVVMSREFKNQSAVKVNAKNKESVKI
jgi:hypothetical protein